MKQILALNAFDRSGADGLDDRTAQLVRQRERLFGAASVLFYQHPIEFVRGEGCRLYDAAGTAYLDVYNNVPSVGHCHPRVVEAVAAQLRQLNTHTRYLHAATHAYAERLLSTFPDGLSNVTFTCTGSESNDLALRQAQVFTGGTGVIVTATAYHGNTAAVTDVSPSSFKVGAPPATVRVVPAPDGYRVPPEALGPTFTAAVEAAIASLRAQGVKPAALLVDSIFSSDGVYADPPGFLDGAVAAIHAAGGLFIADEVQPGFGRTGDAMWGFQRHGGIPDIVTMGKPMGNGYPMGGVVTRPEILDAFCERVGYFNTFGGSPAAAAAGMAVLEVLEAEGLMENARTVGDHLRRVLRAVAARHPVIGDVRGAGLFTGVELVGADGDRVPAPEIATALINALRDRRVLIGAAGPLGHILKVRPPLCFSRADADTVAAATDDALTALGY
ncbi:aspartate aminotransferase family protein [Azospirillum sp. ST 5-10]|uniref:aspartate aminotransferase family protein n=1 Tax=unclassified Azospirillum TaxID=2630922 RepID=UPI003F49E95D